MTEYVIKAYALKKPGSLEITSTRKGRLNIFSWRGHADEYKEKYNLPEEVYPVHIVIDSEELLDGIK